MTDWAAIRAECESGISQRSLATKYGISQAAISKRARKEHWVVTLVIPPAKHDNIQQPPADDPLAIVNKALNDLAKFLEHDGLADLRDHKLFADALSQYVKMKLTIPTEQEQLPFDMRDFLAGCTDEELEIVKPIMHTVQERLAEQAEKITPLRKTG